MSTQHKFNTQLFLHVLETPHTKTMLSGVKSLLILITIFGLLPNLEMAVFSTPA